MVRVAVSCAVVCLAVAVPGAAQSPPDSSAPVRELGGLADLLTARQPGVFVAPAPAVAPSGPRLRIRGPQTFMDSRAPLIILDGLPVSSGATGLLMSGFYPGLTRLDDLRAWAIDSVAVVRGPAAAARYGPDAANGVILIRTRHGRQGAPRWTLTAGASRTGSFDWPATYGGFDTDNPDSSMRSGHCTLESVARGACVQDYFSRRDPLLARRQLMPAWQRQLGIHVQGGTPNLDYLVGWDFENGDGPIALAGPEANQLRTLGQTVRERILDPDRRTNQHAVAHVRWRAGTVELGVRAARRWGHQGVPPLNAVMSRGASGCCNPIPVDSSASLAHAFVPTTTLLTNRWIAALEALWTPAPGLTLRSAVGQDDIRQNVDQILLPGEGPAGSPPAGYVAIERRPDRTRSFDVQASYAFAAGRVALRTTMGLQRVELEREQFDSIGSGSLSAVSRAAERRRTMSLLLEQRVEVGALALSGLVRRDNFSASFEPATHPAVEARVQMTPEIHLRGAYGSAGRWAYAEQQERTREVTGGVGGVVLGGRAAFDVTFYRMISDVFVPTVTFGGPPVDAAEIDNQGVEIALSGTVIDRPGARLTLELGVWGNRNRVSQLEGSARSFPLGGGAPQVIRPRRPVGYYSAAGVPRFSDANGDGIIARSELLVDNSIPGVEAGTPYPTQGASLGARLSLGPRVSLGATVEYQAGHQLFNAVGWVNCLQLVCRQALDQATPLSTQAEIAYRGATPMYFEDADFARLRSLSLTITAPPAWAAALRSRDVSLTIVGYNLVTWTGYTGFDPEPVSAEPGIGSFESKSGGFAAPVVPRWMVLMRLAY